MTTVDGDDTTIDKRGVKNSLGQAIETIVMIKEVSRIMIYPQKIEIHVSDAKTKQKIEKRVEGLLKDMSEYEILISN